LSLIPEEKVDEVRDATDLVDLVSRYIPLRRSGRNFSAPCPFHEEKTPSFYVWPETQTWKCFGCGKGGNAFHFVMERERLTFPEAVRSLANDAGIDLGPEEPGTDRGERDRLYEVLDWTCRFFESRLRRPEGVVVVEYLKRRGITGETAKRFRLGFAPPGWRNLADAARARGFSEGLLTRAGLLRTGERAPYDWFRDRLIFPIEDVRGRVIGFGARTLGDDEPKYLNSPDTALFRKGKTLYALSQARDPVLKDRRIAIVEGYTDVLMAHQNGIDWFVAGLGTGLTREHAALARRFADRVDLVYDGDEAGLRAAERALSAFLEVEADVRVVQLPAGQDPCDFLVEQGKEPFLARMEEGSDVFDFLVERAASRHDLERTAGRIAAVDEVLSAVVKVENPVKRDLLLSRAADAFRITESAVRSRLKVFSGRGGVVSTGPEPVETLVEAPTERLLLEAVLLSPDLLPRLLTEWPPERFRHPGYREIAVRAAAFGGEAGTFEPAILAGRIEDPAAGEALAGILSEGEAKRGMVDFGRQLDDCLASLRRESRLRETRQALEVARESGDEEGKRKLERELFRLRGGSQ